MEREHYVSEIRALRDEIATYSQELSEKTSQLKTLNERCAASEQLVREKDDQLSKNNQELIVNALFSHNYISHLFFSLLIRVFRFCISNI